MNAEKWKKFELHNSKIQESLAAVESAPVETKKQYDLMLESKQLELRKHLKEISQMNDQVIDDIRRKFDTEKLMIVNQEKQKTDQLVEEMETSCDNKLPERKEESRKFLLRPQDEFSSLVYKGGTRPPNIDDPAFQRDI
ncbi:hypothetical protein MKW98_000373 [Papaver atlanticum]|uniref:Uncharacterized protein n=1 Tax=Papaver atlanticum TaxID=357466 RepID=A0AAD4S3L7_9MAGN|nr:hypothetical protein MKW98_000373 [Papaver atlanticum]